MSSPSEADRLREEAEKKTAEDTASAAAAAAATANWPIGGYLNVSLILQLMWSLFLACKDIFALRNKKDLHTADNLLFIVLIDFAVAIFMFSAACASASLTVFFMWDVHLCKAYPRLACRHFGLSVVLAFITWFLQAASSFSGFWLLVSFF